MENITVMFLLFLVKATLVSAVIGCFVCWKTKNTMSGFFDGFALPLCVATFFYLVPSVDIAIAGLATIGLASFLALFFWLVNESCPWVRQRIEREQRDIIRASPLSPVFKKKADG